MHAIIHGIKMTYTDVGRGAPLLFVHGFPLSRGAWRKQISVFKKTHRCVAPDLRGLGASATPGGTITMAHMAEDLAALIAHLNAGPVTLIAHSMGGYVALAFARQFPKLLRGLVLVGTRAGADTPEAAQKRRETAEKVKIDGVKIVIDAMAPKMLSTINDDKAMHKQIRALMAPSSRDGVIGGLLGMAERADREAEMRKIRVPTLIITGSDDALVPPAESEKMAEAIKRSTLAIIPQAGHLVAFEKPREFNDALKDWLDNV
ncbi:MAG: alpha/beta hydrolase [Planctomycetes bacterium]|nr:alpha/beta hydrolase [Planctomycetota bacterium]